MNIKKIPSPKTHLIPTTRNNCKSIWKDLLNQLENNTITVDEVVEKFSNKLIDDLGKMKENKNISECAICAPRTGSYLNKHYGLAKKISLKIFTPNELNEKGIKWSVTNYSHLISNLSKIYKEKEKKEFEEKIEFKKSIILGNSNFCLIKNRPLSKQIKEPTPMPVEISPLEELKPFLDYLNSNKEIEPNFSENKFSGENCMKFIRGSIYQDGRMDLCKQVVGPNWINHLMDSLKNNDKIEHFLLGNNIINIEGALAIKNFLLSNHKSKIQTWYLAGNCIDKQGIKYICEGLTNDINMKYLWLKRNPIHSDGCLYISELLKSNQYIKILDLHNCAIMNDGLKYLCQGLMYNNSLRYLYLDANGINSEGASYLTNYFKNKREKGITSLWIDMNRFENDGIEMILNALKNYPYIKRLNIGSNGLLAPICETIYNTFKESKSLKVLDLGMYKSTIDMGEMSNKLNEDIDFICKLVKENSSILFLNLNHIGLTLDSIHKLCNAILENNTLLFVNYVQYGTIIPNELINKINNKLNINLRKAGLNPNNLDYNFSRYLKHSKKIRFIDSIYRNKM